MVKMFLRVADVMEILGVSESYAYKLIRKLNKEAFPRSISSWTSRSPIPED